MTGEVYTQIQRPVNRLAEKIMGWLSWLLLLGTTIIAMFFGLVLFSNENSIQSLEVEIANSTTFQNILTNYNMTATELVIHLQNGVWAFIVYLIVCLLISFLALISMRHRVISGLLFLVVSILTLPLIVVLVPIFFFIIALMMFSRKERLETVPVYNAPLFTDNPVYEQSLEKDQEKIQREPATNVQYDQDEEPAILSRSAKYHHKQEQETTQSTQTEDRLDDTAVHSEETVTKDKVHDNATDSVQQEKYAYTYDTHEANQQLTQADLKQQKKEEKAQQKEARKEERKARKAYLKEQRKNKPSAASQRRQNYEDRMKVNKERVEQEKEGSNKEKS
ncbi:DUF4064 domain-containing protein [Staphylococcus sp. 17KM0847]|uniref:DUF4064 domain-containing protein n=1 Tax=Staphylococcus sp. 17KM0847 TaxID=2583989 RepID=UPI0015DC303A|nr:DUF4064 domain-containing protein [Staphylococcus sp. 17KM0847]QLK85737.1 DUF4064 domain-containing protein [Staphylococcus sp. 17KM0847]